MELSGARRNAYGADARDARPGPERDARKVQGGPRDAVSVASVIVVTSPSEKDTEVARKRWHVEPKRPGARPQAPIVGDEANPNTGGRVRTYVALVINTLRALP